MIGRALAVWAVLVAAAGIAAWVLTGFADRIAHRADERKAGKGSAPAPGSPAPPVWPQDRATDITYIPVEAVHDHACDLLYGGDRCNCRTGAWYQVAGR
jgi:hypothetical protein